MAATVAGALVGLAERASWPRQPLPTTTVSAAALTTMLVMRVRRFIVLILARPWGSLVLPNLASVLHGIAVNGEGVGEAKPFHHNEAERIDQRELFVGVAPEQRQRCGLIRCGWPKIGYRTVPE